MGFVGVLEVEWGWLLLLIGVLCLKALAALLLLFVFKGVLKLHQRAKLIVCLFILFVCLFVSPRRRAMTSRQMARCCE